MGLATALIGSRPCDVFIAGLGRQGQVIIRLVVVVVVVVVALAVVVIPVATSFSVGEGGREGTMPSSLRPTARACRCMEHVQRHELQCWDLVTNCARSGVRGRQQRAGMP
jgi:hypothetical protein